jgi:hypothetical protein
MSLSDVTLASVAISDYFTFSIPHLPTACVRAIEKSASANTHDHTRNASTCRVVAAWIASSIRRVVPVYGRLSDMENSATRADPPRNLHKFGVHYQPHVRPLTQVPPLDSPAHRNVVSHQTAVRSPPPVARPTAGRQVRGLVRVAEPQSAATTATTTTTTQ